MRLLLSLRLPLVSSAAALLLAACGGGGVGGSASNPLPIPHPTISSGPAPSPTPTSSPINTARLYAANAGSVATPKPGPRIAFFALPLTAGSTSLTAVNSGLSNPLGVAVDPTDSTHFYVANNGVTAGGGSVQIFNRPTSGVATSAGALVGFSNPVGLTFDAAGNMYVPDSGKILRVAHPVAAGAAATTLISGLSSPTCAAVDASDHLYVGDTSLGKLFSYSAPYTSVVPTSTAVGIDSSSPILLCAIQPTTNRIFVVNFLNGGSIVGYNTPLVDNAAPAVTITLPAGIAPGGITFDALGTLYVGTASASSSNISVYAPPFGSSTPTYTFQNGNYFATGLAFGP